MLDYNRNRIRSEEKIKIRPIFHEIFLLKFWLIIPLNSPQNIPPAPKDILKWS